VEKKPRQKITLNFTPELQFEITDFEKLNKGFTNTKQVNCFMNVCLQSLFACPGFFNLVQTLASDAGICQELEKNQGLAFKLIQVQKCLDSKH
jgi:hypothetical protein